MRTGSGSTHRPKASQCHHDGRKPEPEGGVSSSEKTQPTKSGPPKVLVAPIMHKGAFDFVRQLGSLCESVEGCERQGAIIPESRLKAYTCPGGMLEAVSRPADQPVSPQEKSVPLIAVYPISQNGLGGAGRAYQLIDRSAMA